MLTFDYILFDAVTNPAVRFVRTNGQQWNNTSLKLVDTTTYAQTAIVLSENAAVNGIGVQVPALLPDGDYYMIFYDAAAPANTDPYVRIFLIGWNMKSREFVHGPTDIGKRALVKL